MNRVAIIIPTWNNIRYLVQCIRSIKERTEYDGYRIICVPNGCDDGTIQWLQKEGIEFFPLASRSGFVDSTNAGLDLVEPGEHILLLNDDVRITDPLWLSKMVKHFDDPKVGAVGPVSNFILGTQMFILDNLPMAHEAPFLIGLCMLIRSEAFAEIGKLDTAYGIGTNEDLDYSLALREKGYKLIVDRTVFVYHYGSRSLNRIGDMNQMQIPTRETLIKKWGGQRCEELLAEMRAIAMLSQRGEVS